MLFTQPEGKITPQGERTIATLDRLTGARKARLRYGHWTAVSGAVYEEEYSESIHLIDQPFNPIRKRYRAIDFGFVNPFVCLWIGEDHDGTLYVYRQWYKTKMIVEDHARIINQYSKGETYNMPAICDHDAEDKATLKRYLDSHKVISAKKSVKLGIELLKQQLRVNDNGRAGLYILKDSLIKQDEDIDVAGGDAYSLETEFPMYHYDENPRLNSKELPVAQYDHALDALRYAVMSIKRSTVKRERKPSRQYSGGGLQ